MSINRPVVVVNAALTAIAALMLSPPVFRKAVPVVVLMAFPMPLTVTVPPPITENAVAVDVSMSSPPTVKLTVPPVFVSRFTAVTAPALVFSVFVPPLKVTVPAPPLLVTSIPSHKAVHERFPESVAVSVSKLEKSTSRPSVALVMAPL